MNNFNQMTGMALCVSMILACGAEEKDDVNAAIEQGMLDAEMSTSMDLGGESIDMAQADDAANISADVGVGQVDAQLPDTGGGGSGNCESFDGTHFYRQSAERFADYEIREMCDFAGETLLIVNTAARCGLTPQYEGLVNLDAEYGPQGLRILGFLSNDFGNQAGTTDQVETCNSDYRVTFEQFTPIGVLSSSRDGQHPIFEWLTNQPGMEGDIEWNFGKFLVSRDGVLIARWSSYEQPESASVKSAIEEALGLDEGSE